MSSTAKPTLRTLYFDVDGTVVLVDQSRAKPCLANGALEKAVRRAGFERLVCVGNFAQIAATLREIGVSYDAEGVLFGLCRGAFRDEQWFRAVTELIEDPSNRVAAIDLACDWWYVDDLAIEYLRSAGQIPLLLQHERRILATDPLGDGQDILDWLQAV